MTPAVRSTLDVVLWFLDRAASAGSHLSARRLQCLLFMAQARYARANDGRKLMPATFLAAEAGPIEPTIYHIMGHGRPLVTAALGERRGRGVPDGSVGAPRAPAGRGAEPACA